MLNLQEINPNIDPGKKHARIDLAAIHPLDGSISFFEAETALHLNHPTTYVGLADYVWSVIPEAQWTGTTNDLREEQISYANNHGVGIITCKEIVSGRGEVEIRINAKKQDIIQSARQAVITRCKKRLNDSQVNLDLIPTEFLILTPVKEEG